MVEEEGEEATEIEEEDNDGEEEIGTDPEPESVSREEKPDKRLEVERASALNEADDTVGPLRCGALASCLPFPMRKRGCERERKK